MVMFLVMLLAHVFVESAAKSAFQARTGGGGAEMPRMQFGGDPGQNAANYQRQMQEWQQQQQRDFEQMAEKQRSVGRTIRFWMVSSELLAFLLHTGALVTPILAAWGIFVAAGRR